MWWMNCISVLVVSVVLQTTATPTPTDTFPAQTDTAPPPADAIGTLSVQPLVHSTQEPLPVIANQRSGLPIRTGGKPLPNSLPSISQDDNYINENTDPSTGDIPNILFVPIFSQSYYFPERSYPPSMRNVFVRDRSPYGVVQDPNRRNVENALYDSYFFRQNQNQEAEAGTLAFGAGQNFADRFTAFREWILNLFPFRLEFNRPATQVPRPLLNAMPENNIPHPVNHLPTSLNNIRNRVHYISSNIPSSTNDKPDTFSTPVNNLPGNFPSTVNDIPSNFDALTNNIRNSIGQTNIPSNFPIAVNKIPTTAQIIPIRSDNIQTTTSQLPIGVYRQKYTPSYDPLNRELYNFPQRQYLQPNVDLTNRNYAPMINNFRDMNNGQPYAYRQYSPHNVHPYAQTSGVLKGFNPYYSNE